TFGLVQVQRPGYRIQHLRRGTADRSTFQLGVVLHTHTSQGGDLAAPQPRNTAVASLRQPHLARRDPSTPRGQELADLCPVVHRSSSVRPCSAGRRARPVAPRSLLRLGLGPAREGVPPGTPIIRLSHAADHPSIMERGGRWPSPGPPPSLRAQPPTQEPKT